MASEEQGSKHVELEGRIASRAAAFPGSASSPYVDAREELKRTCDWLVDSQTPDGLWPQGRINLRFYSDAYAVRALLAARRIFGEARYLDAACRWLRYVLRIQRSDGGWWVGYSKGDHDYDDPNVDQSVVYVADAGEVSMALVNAFHVLDAEGSTRALADEVKSSLVRFRAFADHFRLDSGAMGIGYTRRDFYDPEHRDRPYMQAHYAPFAFATAVTGVNTFAGIFSVTRDPGDWKKAMQSLDWCLEHMSPGDAENRVSASAGNDGAGWLTLHRVMDWAFSCSAAPMDRSEGADPTPEPVFRSSERQKLYALWKYAMHLLADAQHETGEWPCFRQQKPLALYEGALRHRLFYLYSLTTWLRNGVVRPLEDDRLVLARDRQLWLVADPGIRLEHYGVCTPDAHVMPTGLWGMTLAELIEAGITRPAGTRRARGGRGST